VQDRAKYLERVTRAVKRSKLIWRTSPIVIAAVSTLFWVVELGAIKNYDKFNIPSDTPEYMLQITIERFDNDNFKSMATKAGLSHNEIKTLLFIYYSYYGFNIASALCALWFVIGDAFNVFIRREKMLFYQVELLRQYIEDLSFEFRRGTARKAIGLVRSIRLPGILNPLKNKWRQTATYDWFNQNPMTRETIRILAAIKSFEGKALGCLKGKENLSSLRDAVNALGDFSYLTSAWKDGISVGSKRAPTREERVDSLLEFANCINRIQPTHGKEKGQIGRLVDAAANWFRAREFKTTTAIAIIAAVVVWLGSIIFDISSSTAFLTWFSVVFGSLAVSVGITSITIKK